MNKEQKLGLLFSGLADKLNITETLYNRAVTAYTALADYIKDNNKDWEVEIFPHGSFELGTVIKPVNDEDEYDVDLVVLVRAPDFRDAHKLRETIRTFLESHGRYEGKIEEKKQCLRVVYSDNAQFHMDVVCAKSSEYDDKNIIEVAKKDEQLDEYDYKESNPKGYIDWFKKTMNYKRLLQEARFQAAYEASTEVQELSLPKMKTPLQKAIQILKRHRDIYFQNNLDNRPSSIVITTLCALSYDNAKLYNSSNDNVYLAIKKMLETFPMFLGADSSGQYKLPNPSFHDENFLYKWNTDANLKKHFFQWIEKARLDIVTNPFQFLEDNPGKMRDVLFSCFGSNIARAAFESYGETYKKLNDSLRIDKNTMSTTLDEGESTVKPKLNTFYGDSDAKK